MREYTSMMTIILEIAYDDQEQPVDEELVRKGKELRDNKNLVPGEGGGAAAELCPGVGSPQADEQIGRWSNGREANERNKR